MIAIWNRSEVYVGNSLQEFNRILDILAAEKIKYRWKRVNRVNFSRTSTFGTLGTVDTSQNDMYYIYVHKKDADEVPLLIRKR